MAIFLRECVSLAVISAFVVSLTAWADIMAKF